jgi:hypothetical protein
MNLTFLLGSGISIPAIPCVKQLTEVVLSGTGMIETDNVCPFVTAPTEKSDRQNMECLIFLRWLKAQAMVRYTDNPHRRVNYEDLAYLAGQIADDIHYEHENPALYPFILKALTELHAFLPSVDTRKRLGTLAKMADRYITRTVAHEIKSKEDNFHQTGNPSWLQFFAEACADGNVERVDIFTTNHDTLLETFLRETLDEAGFSIIDGLRHNSDKSWRFDPSVYDNPPDNSKRINIFKLHGSVEWCRYVCHNTSEFFTGVSTKPGYDRVDEKPSILLGTFNKILRYHAQPFLELQYRFMNALKSCNALVVCGYGFGDKGVNTRIVEWIKSREKNRLLIIDPVKSECMHARSRASIQNITNSIFSINKPDQSTGFDSFGGGYAEEKWKGPFHVKHISRKLEEVSWKRVKGLIIAPLEQFSSSEEVG